VGVVLEHTGSLQIVTPAVVYSERAYPLGKIPAGTLKPIET